MNLDLIQGSANALCDGLQLLDLSSTEQNKELLEKMRQEAIDLAREVNSFVEQVSATESEI